MHRVNEIGVKLYVTIMPVVSVFVTEITAILFLPIAFILDFVIDVEVIKMLSQFFGMVGGFLVAVGGFWYVKKMILESRKAKYDLIKATIEERKAQSELRIKEIEVQEREIDNKIKAKDLELFELTREKMIAEEDEEHKQRLVRIKELEKKLNESDSK